MSRSTKPHRQSAAARSWDDGTVRKCIVTGARKPREELVRFVIGPEGEPIPDLEERLPGRGLWLSAQRDVVNTACAKGGFAKAARRSVRVPDDLGDRVEHLLARRCVNLIGLARRSGDLWAGFEKVHTAVSKGDAGLLIVARGCVSDGRRKLMGRAPELPIADLLADEEMGGAIGRQDAVYMAVRKGPMANRLLKELTRLNGFRSACRNDRNENRFRNGTGNGNKVGTDLDDRNQ